MLNKPSLKLIFISLFVFFNVNNSFAQEFQNKTPISAQNPNEQRLVLKNSNVFMCLNLDGQIPQNNSSGLGLYLKDTRFLDSYNWTFANKSLINLKTNVSSGYCGQFIYTNCESQDIPSQSVFIDRQAVILDGLKEKIKITNYHTKKIDEKLILHFDSDFADMFEVRGSARTKRGTNFENEIDTKNKSVELKYKSLDNIMYSTTIFLSTNLTPIIKNNSIEFDINLEPQKSQEIFISVIPKFANIKNNYNISKLDFAKCQNIADKSYKNWLNEWASINTSNKSFNKIVQRIYADLFMLQEPLDNNTGIAAGIPWFNACFGRDEIICALEVLPLNHTFAKNIILLLSHYQGTKFNDITQECPGKIMHELRLGEMTRLKEVPFGPYYGTIDATPLYLILISKYVEYSNDTSLLKKIYPNIKAALKYLDWETAQTNYGPYLSYGRTKNAHLSNQGWKDSYDSVMYANGQLAKPPISLAEVQGYLYEAYISQAKMALIVNDTKLNKELLAKAKILKKQFNKDFKMKNYVALALDGQGKQCAVLSSNAGQLLFTGILNDDLEHNIITKLDSSEMYSGWGIRTLGKNEINYNPMSYHDGSVWPHDNALIVEGLCRCGAKSIACKIFNSMIEACHSFPQQRLPELFCGFDNDHVNSPIKYPVSCYPQAWASGSLMLMLTSCLGINIDGLNNKIVIKNPILPQSINEVSLKNLQVGKNPIDLKFIKNADGKISVKVLKNCHNVSININ